MQIEEKNIGINSISNESQQSIILKTETACYEPEWFVPQATLTIVLLANAAIARGRGWGS